MYNIKYRMTILYKNVFKDQCFDMTIFCSQNHTQMILSRWKNWAWVREDVDNSWEWQYGIM